MNHWMQRVFKGACTRCLNWSAGCVLLLENKLKLGFILCCSLAWTRPSIRSMSPGLPWLCVCDLQPIGWIKHHESDTTNQTTNQRPEFWMPCDLCPRFQNQIIEDEQFLNVRQCRPIQNHREQTGQDPADRQILSIVLSSLARIGSMTAPVTVTYFQPPRPDFIFRYLSCALNVFRKVSLCQVSK